MLRIDDALVLRAVDDGSRGAVIERAGAVGLRADNAGLEIDDLRVERF